jgi:hypothetical protein
MKAIFSMVALLALSPLALPFAGVTSTGHAVALFVGGALLALVSLFVEQSETAPLGRDWSELEAEMAHEDRLACTVETIDRALSQVLLAVAAEATETPAAHIESAARTLAPVGLAVWKNWTIQATKNARIFFRGTDIAGKTRCAPLPKTLHGASELDILRWSVRLLHNKITA